MTIFKIEWRNNLKSLLIWVSIFGILGLIFAGIYPQMFTSNMKTVMNQMMGNLSPQLLEVFHIQMTGPASLMTPSGFFAYYFQYMFLAAAIYAMLVGANALVKEETDGTLDFLYAQPVTRCMIVMEKFAANLCMLLAFWTISAVISVASFAIFREAGDDLQEIIREISKIYAADFVVLLFFLCLGFCCSALFTSSKQVTGVSLGVVFTFYLMGMISGLYDKASWLGSISPIYLGTPASVLEKGLQHGIWLIISSVLLIIGTLMIYQRKDLRNS